MKKLTLSVIAAVLTVLGLGGIATISPAYAAGFFCPDGTYVSGGTDYASACSAHGGVPTTDGKSTDLMGVLNIVINVVLGVIGFIAVVMIILGGISFTTSQGDTAKTTKARNTILYGVVGLVIALLAFAIVNFVLNSVFGSNASSAGL